MTREEATAAIVKAYKEYVEAKEKAEWSTAIYRKLGDAYLTAQLWKDENGKYITQDEINAALNQHPDTDQPAPESF